MFGAQASAEFKTLVGAQTIYNHKPLDEDQVGISVLLPEGTCTPQQSREYKGLMHVCHHHTEERNSGPKRFPTEW
jgi:hypothetical protein